MSVDITFKTPSPLSGPSKGKVQVQKCLLLKESIHKKVKHVQLKKATSSSAHIEGNIKKVTGHEEWWFVKAM